MPRGFQLIRISFELPMQFYTLGSYRNEHRQEPELQQFSCVGLSFRYSIDNKNNLYFLLVLPYEATNWFWFELIR